MTDLSSECIPIVRHLVDDVNPDSYEYSDERLSALVFIAASYVNTDFQSGYSISLCGQTINPEPSSQFISLTALKAACMLLRGIHTSWARSDFRVTDGPTTVDVKGIADKVKVAAASACQEYEKLKLDIQMGGTFNGQIISTPSSESC